jgi:hypothetical protein
MRARTLLLTAAVCSLSAQILIAEEGMWLLNAFPKLPPDRTGAHGLALDPTDIAGPDSAGLMSAVVQLGGGTGSFISRTGLILTNHHVAYGSIQSLSTLEHDYLKDGFLAHSPEEELSIATTAEIVLSIKDVTAEVLEAATPGLSEAERGMAIQKKMRSLESEAKGTGNLTCRVSELYQGLQYALFTSLILRDIRLVYAPPSSIGNFGGEVDNWIWPRHTGDFTILRAYVAPDGSPAKYSKDNTPFPPRRFLPISSRGIADGDFAMAIGFPGRTYRYREAAGVEYARDVELPAAILYYKIRMDAMEAATSGDRLLQIKYASKIRRLANPYKKYVGVLEGMQRADLLTAKRHDDEHLAAWIASSPERSTAYGSLLKEMRQAYDTLKDAGWKNAFFSNLNGVELLAAAKRLLTYVEGFPKDDGGNVLPPTDDQRNAMGAYVTDLFKNFDPHVDSEVMVALMRASADLPATQRIDAFRDILDNRKGAELETRIRRFVDDLYEDTHLGTEEGCLKLLNAGADDILEDPFVLLAQQLNREQTPGTERMTAHNTAIGPLRRRYVEAWLACQNRGTVYPDANRTIRLTYGRVQDLRPRDAVELSSRTLLRGVMEKEKHEAPFVVPARLRELWDRKDFGPYAEKKTLDVPVAFIADLDITGGNSGSPVVNGRGELVGCAFDGNWESVVGDYIYQDRYNRCISVDARYVLFILDKFAGAANILKELVVK